jgi:hypothetical protein
MEDVKERIVLLEKELALLKEIEKVKESINKLDGGKIVYIDRPYPVYIDRYPDGTAPYWKTWPPIITCQDNATTTATKYTLTTAHTEPFPADRRISVY